MRQDPRVPFAAEVRVKCQSWDQFAVVAAQNLSRGGIFLRTSTPAPLHSRVQVVLTDPNGSEFQIAGRIAHVVSPDRAAAENREPGIGVQFEPAEPRIAEAIFMLVRLHAPSHLSGLGRRPSLTPARLSGPEEPVPPISPRQTLAGMLAGTESAQARPAVPERRTRPVGSGDAGVRPVEVGSTLLFESAREPEDAEVPPPETREARSTLRGAAPPAPVTEGRRSTLFGLAPQAAPVPDPAPPPPASALTQTLRGIVAPAAPPPGEAVEIADDDVPIEVELPTPSTVEPPTVIPAGDEPPTVIPGREPPTLVPLSEAPTPAAAEPPSDLRTTLMGVPSPLAPQADEPATTVWARTVTAPPPEVDEEIEIEADEPVTASLAPPSVVPSASEPATRATERDLPLDRREALRTALRRELRRVWSGTPHEVLGATPGEPLAALRQRLVQRTKRFHPNAHLRAAPDVRRLLREITTRLVAAYATVAREERLQRHLAGAPALRSAPVSLPPDPMERYEDLTLAAPPAPPHDEVARQVEAARGALSERRYEDARCLFEAAIALDPDDAAARAGRELVLGVFALAAQNEALAQQHLEAALALDDGFDEAALQLGRLHQRRRDSARNPPRRLGG